MASLRYEVVVIGGGVAGAAAATALKQRGKSVAVVAANIGATSVSSGAWDLGPLPPLGAPGAWEETYSRLLLDKKPADLLGAKDAELKAFVAELSHDLRIDLAPEAPFTLPTAAGTWKRTFGAQALQARADIGQLRGAKVAFVASRQWRFPSELVAARLAAGAGISISPLWIELKGADWPLPQLAARLMHDIRFKELFRERLRAALDVTAYDVLLFPPLFLDPGYADALATDLRVSVVECLATQDPIAGKRMTRAISGTLNRLSIPYYPVAQLVPEIAKGKILSLRGGAAGSSEFRADRFVLATGRYFGGGLELGYERLSETIFGLPLFSDRTSGRKRLRRELRSPGWESLGIWANEVWQPVDETGRPVLINLFACGSIIGGIDYAASGFGMGFLALSGRRCGAEI